MSDIMKIRVVEMASKTADFELKNCIELGHIVGLMVITDLTFMKHSAVM